MATNAINFTKMHNKKYRLYRAMQAPGIWGNIYRERIRLLEKYKSGILFPEMILGLNQKNIYATIHAVNYDKFNSTNTTNNVIQVSIIVIPTSSLRIQTNGDSDLSVDCVNIDQINYLEDNHNNEIAIKFLFFHISTSVVISFAKTPYLFSNKKDAVKCACRLLEANTNNLF